MWFNSHRTCHIVHCTLVWYILHEICVRLVEQEGCQTSNVDWSGRLQGGWGGGEGGGAAGVSCVMLVYPAVQCGGLLLRDTRLRAGLIAWALLPRVVTSASTQTCVWWTGAVAATLKVVVDADIGWAWWLTQRPRNESGRSRQWPEASAKRTAAEEGMSTTARKAEMTCLVGRRQLPDDRLDHAPAETGIQCCSSAKLVIIRQPAVLPVFLVAVCDDGLVCKELLRQWGDDVRWQRGKSSMLWTTWRSKLGGGPKLRQMHPLFALLSHETWKLAGCSSDWQSRLTPAPWCVGAPRWALAGEEPGEHRRSTSKLADASLRPHP